MATQFATITSPSLANVPPSNVRVAFVAGPAVQAIDHALAKLPAHERGCTLDDLDGRGACHDAQQGEGSLFHALDRHDAWAFDAEDDDDLTAWCDSAYAVLERIEALPNTPAYLAIRARAVGSAVDNSSDLANLNLGELAAHAEGIAGRLIRQILESCAGGADVLSFRKNHFAGVSSSKKGE
jgi:hypothetical protein